MAVLGLAARATAEPISTFTEGPGHSWDVTWDDTTDGNPITEIVAVIVSGNATFDLPITTTIPTWTAPGTLLVSKEETFISGPTDYADKDITLSFAEPEPDGGVVVDIYEMNGSHLAAYGSFQWEDLPSQGNWVNLPKVPDGGLTASMLGLGFLGLCYVRRMVK